MTVELPDLDLTTLDDEALLAYVESLSIVARTYGDTRDRALALRLDAYEEARRRTPPIQHKALAARADVSTSAIINALKDKHEREAKAAKR